MEVVPLRTRSTVSDVPGMLRNMADMIERGEVEAPSALFIVPVERGWPQVYGWGEHLGDAGNIALCEITKTWFINQTID